MGNSSGQFSFEQHPIINHRLLIWYRKHFTIGTLEVVNITEVAVAVVRHVTDHRTVTASSIVPAALNATIVAIADETDRAVIVNFTTTQVRVSIVTTNGEKLGAVGVLDAT